VVLPTMTLPVTVRGGAKYELSGKGATCSGQAVTVANNVVSRVPVVELYAMVHPG
jgi:hypothetical protein